MKTPHKHADVIKAWADGAEVQYQSQIDAAWYSTKAPSFEESYEWRIKPEPKPDGKVEFSVQLNTGDNEIDWNFDVIANLQLTFDGETGKLKAAEVL